MVKKYFKLEDSVEAGDDIRTFKNILEFGKNRYKSKYYLVKIIKGLLLLFYISGLISLVVHKTGGKRNQII